MQRLLIKNQIPHKLIHFFSSRAKCAASQHIQPSSTIPIHHKDEHEDTHENEHVSCSPSFSHVNATQAPQQQENTQFQFHPNSALVYPDFISTTEASILKEDVMKRMQRTRFQKGHWDAVIQYYKEVELLSSSTFPSANTNANANANTNASKHQMSQVSLLAMERVRNHISQTHFFPSSDNEDEKHDALEWLNCHAIYLKKEGLLTAHVDSIKFSGDIVAGLSLLSSSIMRLRPASSSELARRDGIESDGDGAGAGDDLPLERQEDADDGGDINTSKALMDAGYVDLYLPPRSLYVLSGVSRYTYTHEILPCNSRFEFGSCHGNGNDNGNGDHVNVQREDRISIMFRDAI
jgi:alkylated DNA repair protein alkB family protein 7